MNPVARCSALLISAIASGQGKTTLTAALARRARREGRRVTVFKAGPDFIDPQILEAASGRPVGQLDAWMCGAEDGARRLHRAALESDLLLVEGVMGLFDGTPSTADLACGFGLPTVVALDGAAMAQTFGAVIRGLAATPGAPRIVGAFANRVGSAGHAALLRTHLPDDIPLLGRLAEDASLKLPERHLGLHQAIEIPALDANLDALADALVLEPAYAAIARHPVEWPSPPSPPAGGRPLDGVRIGIAADEAFSFRYPANVEALEELGATLAWFSPLRDGRLPEVDSLWLPGGYPELHAERFAANRALHADLREHHARGKPLLAECGGMMALLDTLVEVEGRRHAMAGLLRGESRMQRSVQAIGPQILPTAAGDLRGHTFHHSKLEAAMGDPGRARHPHGGPGEVIFRERRLTASYVHAYFPSSLEATASLFAP